MPGTNDTDFDPQDQAEAFDEDNLLGDDRAEIRSFAGDDDSSVFEDLPDGPDLLEAEGDRDDDEALALDADEFDPDAIGDADTEDDHELGYHAATADREDDIDGLGDEDSFDEDRLDLSDGVEGLDEEVRDAGEVSGGEDDVFNFQSKGVDDAGLKRMGYSETRDGETRAKPDRD